MRIEEGKFYRTRDGQKVGPVYKNPKQEGQNYFWRIRDVDYVSKAEGEGGPFNAAWREDGSFYGQHTAHPLDLVAEWTEHSPIVIETVTVRRLESGVYGRLEVSECIARDPSVPVVGLKLVDRTGSPGPNAALSAPELRELARVALEIAEYLDAQ